MREVQKVDLNRATPHQRIAIDKIIEFIDSPDQMMTLEGYAGTGKSYCVNLITEMFINDRGYNIAIGALTHKAVFVLTRMAEFESDYLSYNTIHSVLAVKPFMTDDGEEIFIKDKKARCRVGEYDFIIVDEMSMLDDKLFSYLKEELDKNPEVKVLFVGDGKQLKPPKQAISVPASAEAREKFGIRYAVLTEIVRQKGTNPIIPLSKGIRINKFNFKTELNDKKEGVIVVPKQSQHKILKSMFCCEEFEENTDYCRLVSWQNAQVNYYNDVIRRLMYRKKIENYYTKNQNNVNLVRNIQEKCPFFDIKTKKVGVLPNIVKGDKVIADKPIFEDDGETIKFHTNTELLIEDLVVVEKLVEGDSYMVYEASVSNLWSDKKDIITIIHEVSQRDLEIKLNEIKEKAIKQNAIDKHKGGRTARLLWTRYYALDKAFAKLKYLPSMTTYKSQGSTYENVIVNVRDINKVYNINERLQHLYVGVTRASKRVFIFN